MTVGDLVLVLLSTVVIVLLLWSVRVTRDLRTLRAQRADLEYRMWRLELLPVIAGALEKGGRR